MRRSQLQLWEPLLCDDLRPKRFSDIKGREIGLLMRMLCYASLANPAADNCQTMMTFVFSSLHIWSDGSVEKKEKGPTKTTIVEADCVCGPRSVQWMDFGRSLLLDDLLEHYHAMLWSLCSKALWVKLHMGQTGNAAGSSNLQDLGGFQVLHRVTQVLKTGNPL